MTLKFEPSPAFTLGALLLLTAIACSKPPPSDPGPALPQDTAQQLDLEQARSGAEDQGKDAALMLRRSLLTTVERHVTARVPHPPLKMFPGLKAPRLRTSVDRVKKDGPKPVLLLMLDTTRADRLSAYGHDRPTSPNLKALADDGILFSRFYSNGTWTRPSVASIMTSMYRKDHLIELGGVLTDRHDTVAEVFKENGYATAAFVGNQTVRGEYNFNKGFDHYEDIHDEIEHNPEADEMVERTINWLDNNDNDNWFIWLFLVDPHDPYTPRKEFDQWETDSKYQRVGVPQFEYPGNPPKELVDRMLALYDAEILQMDTAIGDLFDYFKENDIWDDLTVVVVTDHGEAFGEHRCFRHPYHPWEANIHVPFIIRSPEFASGRGHVEDRLFHSVDVAPTMIDLAGLKAPERWKPTGLSAAQVLTGSMLEGWDRAVYTEQFGYGMRRWVIRQGDYKYMRFNPTNLELLEKAWETFWEQLATANHDYLKEYLFDLSKDPWEKKNVKRKEKEVFKLMRKELQAFTSGKRDAPGAKTGPVAEEFDPDDLDDQALEDLRSLGYIE